MSNETPFDFIAKWLDELPRDIKGTVCFFLAVSWPNGMDRLEEEEVGEEWKPTEYSNFISYLQKLSHSAGVLENAGLAIMLTALIDDSLEGKTTRKDWDKARDFQERFLADIEAEYEGQHTDPIRKNLERMPLQSRQWLEQAKKWRDLRQGILSHAAISNWRMDTLSADRKLN